MLKVTSFGPRYQHLMTSGMRTFVHDALVVVDSHTDCHCLTVSLRCSAFEQAAPLRLSSEILFRSNASRCAGGILARSSAAISDTVR